MLRLILLMLGFSVWIATAVAANNEAPKVPKQTGKIGVFYSQFFIQPPKGSKFDYVPFQDKREHAQGFSAWGDAAAIGTPSETASCNVTIESGSKMPELNGVVQAVAFPLEVTESALILQNTVGSRPEARFDVPSGKYVTVARFYPEAPSAVNAKVGKRQWRVVITFLQPGIVSPGTFKMLEEKTLPKTSEIYLPKPKVR